MQHHYCLDFVRTDTGEPVNHPFKYELWKIPDPVAPWLSLGAMRLHTIEETFRVSADMLQPGAEKIFLSDGLTCLLKRPGERDIHFKVPIRTKPQPVGDVHVIDFPERVI